MGVVIQRLLGYAIRLCTLLYVGCTPLESVDVDGGGLDANALDAGMASDGGEEVRPDASLPGPAMAAQLFPMGVGSKWTFEVSGSNIESECGDGIRVAEIVGVELVEGVETFHYLGYCTGGSRYYAYSPDGLDLWNGSSGTWYPFLRDPVADGASWDVTSALSVKWRYEGTVDVPAGTYVNCWTYVISNESEYTLCPGIGLVAADGANVGHRAELVSYEPGV